VQVELTGLAGWGEAASLSVSSSEHVFERLRLSNQAPWGGPRTRTFKGSFGSWRREAERDGLWVHPIRLVGSARDVMPFGVLQNTQSTAGGSSPARISKSDSMDPDGGTENQVEVFGPGPRGRSRRVASR
jgi:hypothetical protein